MSERRATYIRTEEGISSGRGPTRILLATDGSRVSELAAKTAVELSRKFGSRLVLARIMLVSSSYSGFGPDEDDTLTIYQEDTERAQKLLEKQVKQLEDEGVAVEKAHLRAGEPDAEVVSLAKEVGADLVVVGSRGPGAFKGMIMGDVSESIVRHAHCPVWVVCEQEHTSDGRRE